MAKSSEYLVMSLSKFGFAAYTAPITLPYGFGAPQLNAEKKDKKKSEFDDFFAKKADAEAGGQWMSGVSAMALDKAEVPSYEDALQPQAQTADGGEAFELCCCMLQSCILAPSHAAYVTCTQLQPHLLSNACLWQHPGDMRQLAGMLWVLCCGGCHVQWRSQPSQF